jgi:hypothetical protein
MSVFRPKYVEYVEYEVGYVEYEASTCLDVSQRGGDTSDTLYRHVSLYPLYRRYTILYHKDVSIPLCVRTYGQMVIYTSTLIWELYISYTS